MNQGLKRWLAAVALLSASAFTPALFAQQAGAQGSNTAPTAKAAGTATPAQSATSESVLQAFLLRFPGVPVESVTPTPFMGLYEIRIGTDLLYTDPQVKFVMQGSLIDAESRTDLTAQRLEEINRVAFSSLPLDLAIKQVKGDGSRKIAVFEDPNCGYCKQLHNTLKSVDNITVYTLLLPILSPDSTEKSRNIWCAQDQAKAWKDWMLDRVTPPTAQCDAPLEKLLALGRDMNVTGTPAIIFADGSRVNGALPLKALEQKLASVKE
jgi:thiol:disulfide interchange protein DsbC